MGSASPVRNSAGEIIAGLVVFPDVTDRKRAQEEIQESERQYRTLFESAGDGILLMRYERFVDCNAQMVKMLGYDRERIAARYSRC